MAQILSDVLFFYKRHLNALLSYIILVSATITGLSMLVANSLSGLDELEQIKTLLAINFAFNPIYLGGLIYLLSNLSHDKVVKNSQCLSFGLTKWLPLLAVSILYGLLTGMGFFLFVLPGIWIFIRLVLAPFLVAIDKFSPIDALRESFILTQPKFWDIFGVTSLIFLLLLLVQQTMMTYLPDSLMMKFISSVVGDILWSFLTIIWFRFYDLLKNGK